MKQKNFILSLFAGIALIFSACQKENSDIFLPDNGQPTGADTNWVVAY